ncbi:MAG TPA: deoxyuridine 5'-triphosphate nucleotidohydrolase [Lachnospiraceae bacterium]|nr:deoxyuridine 5'-triphosphate nucleotidohydrolase [Lachnospiraceae bacterium]
MQAIARFEKVSFEEYSKAMTNYLMNEEGFSNKQLVDALILETYGQIQLPKRATTGSAGYDFKLPISITLGEDTTQTIPTGIRCKMEEGWVLQLYPRSGHGFKYGIQLANTVGIIDSDYYNSDNEGHIFVKLVNNSVLARNITIKEEEAFCQGVFVPFGITHDDNVSAQRNGGMGSTNETV